MLEYKRRGNFIRVYPCKNSDFYDCFLSQQNKQMQQVLYYFLCSDIFLQLGQEKENLNELSFKPSPLLEGKLLESKRYLVDLVWEYMMRLKDLLATVA